MADEASGGWADQDPEARTWIDAYVAHWEPDLRERGLLEGDPPRLRRDFCDALVRAWRGHLRPPASAAPPAPEIPDGAVEG